MFNTLLESKRTRQKSAGTTFVSTVVHAVLIAAAILGTKQVATTTEDNKEAVNYVKPPEEQPPEEPKEPPPPDQPNTPPPPKGFQTLTAPVEIPKVIPQIDLMARVTNELDFTATGVQGGVGSGVVGGTGKVDDDSPYFMFEVEKMAESMPGNPEPEYPSILKQTRQAGKVLVSFVVDTAGRADMSTFKVVESSNPLFTASVKKVLPRYRFRPAEIGNRKVPVFVQLPFEFRLAGGDE
jgi:protein TonB